MQGNWRNMSAATFERNKKPALVKVALNVVMNSETVLVLVKLWKLTRNDLQTTIMLTYVPISFFSFLWTFVDFFPYKKIKLNNFFAKFFVSCWDRCNSFSFQNIARRWVAFLWIVHYILRWVWTVRIIYFPFYQVIFILSLYLKQGKI